MVRYKHRYFVTEYTFTPGANKVNLHKSMLLSLIESKLQRMHGDYGVGIVGYGLDIKYFNPNTQIAVIRSRHGPHKLIGSTLPFIQTPIMLKTLTVKATILKSFQFIKNYQLKQLEKLWNCSDKEKKDLKFDSYKDDCYLKKTLLLFQP